MANSNQRKDAPSKTHLHKTQKQETGKLGPDEKSALQHLPVKQVNPDHEGLNPTHLGPAQPRKPGK